MITLCLYNTDIKDGDLAYLRDMRSLERLDLGRTYITDDCVKYLHGYRKLKLIEASETFLTEAGIDKLSKANNGAYVEY